MATDQEIRDAGFKYIPQQQYLANPFEIPTSTEEPIIDQGIVNTNAFAGGRSEDKFNVYNPDPNKIKNYRPNYEYRQFADGYDPNLSPTMNMKMMEVDPNYKGADYYNPPDPTGLQNLVSFAGNFMPGKGVATFLDSFMPVNKRSIMENELAGMGVSVDDIGRIVQGEGDYNTAENVMAGYNAAAMSADTFDKRIARLEKTLEDKYGSATYTGDKTKLDERLKAVKKAKQNFLDAQSITDDIYDFEKEEKEKKRKNNILFKLFNKKNKQGEQDITTSTDGSGGAITTIDTPTSQGNGGGNRIINITNPYSGGEGGVQSNFGGPTGVDAGTADIQDYADIYAKGGRVGFNTGGHSRFEVGSGYYGEDTTKSVSEEGGGNNQNKTIVNTNDNNKIVDTSNLFSKSPEISFNLSDPKNIALLNAKLYNKNILDNDDVDFESTLSSSLGPFNFVNYFTDEGLKNTNVSTDALGGLITSNISPDKTLRNIEYNRGPFTAGYNNGNYYAKLGINFKNGGLASIL
jgi:hypothetical protein